MNAFFTVAWNGNMDGKYKLRRKLPELYFFASGYIKINQPRDNRKGATEKNKI